jgi:hypothetical protein
MAEKLRWYQFVLWATGGAASMLLSLYGCFASMMFNFGKLEDFSLALALALPLPLFLISILSLRWSAALLFCDFVGLWIVRLNIRPNPEHNPFDSLGLLYLCPAIITALLALSKREHKPMAPAE